MAGIDPEQLRQQLRRETDVKATKQLTVALLYDAGSHLIRSKSLRPIATAADSLLMSRACVSGVMSFSLHKCPANVV